MPYAASGGVRIHYRVEGSGPALVLLHGFSDSLESWYEYRYAEALSGNCRLILVDARGHGASDKPHDVDAYRSTAMVGDVVSVLDACDVEQAHFYGYSMGGALGLVMAKLHPQRLRSLIVGGASPVADALPAEVVEELDTRANEGAAAFVEVWESQGTISPELRSRLLANDMAALNALQENQDWVAVDDVPLTFRRPLLLIMGENDWQYPIVAEYSARLKEGALASLPGLNHLEAFQRCELVAPRIARFVDGVSE